MVHQTLHLSYIGIKMYQDDYRKVQGIMPTPSYTSTLQGYGYLKIILIYAIEGYITSPSQYYWISNIKLGLQNYLCVPFTYEEDFTITDTTEVTSIVYDIKALSLAFKASKITYPKIMYPSAKQEVYRRLCWYGKRLIHQKYFTKEAMIATALQMNSKLKDKYSNKDLHKKALGAYMFIDENRERLSVRLDEVQLKEAHSKGAIMKNKKQAQQTKEKVQQLVKSGDFIKANGKVNLSSLAKAMNMTRKTVAKYV